MSYGLILSLGWVVLSDPDVRRRDQVREVGPGELGPINSVYEDRPMVEVYKVYVHTNASVLTLLCSMFVTESYSFPAGLFQKNVRQGNTSSELSTSKSFTTNL